jgi:hypothetical protein
VTTHRYPRPIGRRSQCAAKCASSTRATITFLGEQPDILDPERPGPYFGRYGEGPSSVDDTDDALRRLPSTRHGSHAPKRLGG